MCDWSYGLRPPSLWETKENVDVWNILEHTYK